MTRFRIPTLDVGPVPGGLGRHVNHDPRSRAYAHRPSATTLDAKVWQRSFDVLDQAQTGSCTGNAMLGVIYTGPLFSALSVDLRAKFPAVETVARDIIYHLATTLDGFPGVYPPDDTGSDGLSASKAAQSLGLISGYRHALSVDDALAAVSHDSPVITGVNWYPSFDQPDPTGLVRLPKRLSAPRGGHEFLVYGIDPVAETVLARNSWSTSWGGSTVPGSNVGPGEFRFPWADWERLLIQDGDVTVPVPVNKPAPTPAPSDGQTICDNLTAATTAAVTWIRAHM